MFSSFLLPLYPIVPPYHATCPHCPASQQSSSLPPPSLSKLHRPCQSKSPWTGRGLSEGLESTRIPGNTCMGEEGGIIVSRTHNVIWWKPPRVHGNRRDNSPILTRIQSWIVSMRSQTHQTGRRALVAAEMNNYNRALLGISSRQDDTGRTVKATYEGGGAVDKIHRRTVHESLPMVSGCCILANARRHWPIYLPMASMHSVLSAGTRVTDPSITSPSSMSFLGRRWVQHNCTLDHTLVLSDLNEGRTIKHPASQGWARQERPSAALRSAARPSITYHLLPVSTAILPTNTTCLLEPTTERWKHATTPSRCQQAPARSWVGNARLFTRTGSLCRVQRNVLRPRQPSFDVVARAVPVRWSRHEAAACLGHPQHTPRTTATSGLYEKVKHNQDLPVRGDFNRELHGSASLREGLFEPMQFLTWKSSLRHSAVCHHTLSTCCLIPCLVGACFDQLLHYPITIITRFQFLASDVSFRRGDPVATW